MNRLLLPLIILTLVLLVPLSAGAEPFAETQAGIQLAGGMERYGPDKHGIIYGRFDGSPAKLYLYKIMVLKHPYKESWLSRPSNDSERNAAEKEYGFYWAIVKPGQYFVHQFFIKEPHMLGQDLTYTTSRGPNFKPLEVKAGELAVWSSTKLIRTKNMTWTSVGQFESQPVPLEEREILTRMLQCAKGTKWEPIIAERLNSLPAQPPAK